MPPPPTLDCDPYGYLIQNQTLFRVDISNGDTTPVKEKVGPVGQINALGYNPVDNYLYAMARNGSGNVLLQIGADGSSKVIPSDVPDSYPEDYNNGAVTSDGHFWISSRGRMWRELDLSDPDSSNFGKSIDSGNSAQSLNATGSPATYDWVSLPTRPGQLLAIGSGDSNTTSKLLSWSTTTHEWTVVRNYGVLDGAAYIGAAYTTNGDVFYGTSNQSGDVFKFDLNNLDEDPACYCQGTAI